WMLYLTGQRAGAPDLVEFARPLVAPLLERAAQPSGCWASGLRGDGGLDRSSQWWIFAELDQAAATLAVREPSPSPSAGYLANSYGCCSPGSADHKTQEVGASIPADWTQSWFAEHPPPKIHSGRAAITRWSMRWSR